MHLWRQYLEQYAENEGNPEQQIIVGAYHAVEVVACLTEMLDREGKNRELIGERIGYFREGCRRAKTFEDRLLNASYALYNHLNTLTHQCIMGNPEGERLIQQIEEQAHVKSQAESQVERSAEALRASFPFVSLITLVLDERGAMTGAIRRVEQRFLAGATHAPSAWEHLLNALYRSVEMLQLLVTLSDPELKDQAQQIASRFHEEDETRELLAKVRNGFCRMFELGHLLTTHVDEIL